MVDIRVDIEGLDEVVKEFGDLGRKQIPFATAMALTKTGQRIKEAVKGSMKGVFKSPTRFTLNSLMLTPATKKRPVATVWFRDFAGKGTPAAKYLTPQVEGGGRGWKRFEAALSNRGYLRRGWYAMPGQGARLNKSGNMSQGQIAQILTALDVMPGRPTIGGREVIQKKRSKAVKEIFGVRAGEIRGRLIPGVYRRTRRGVKPLLIFTNKKPQYKKRLPFYEIALKTYDRHFNREFDRALRQAMRTAR